MDLASFELKKFFPALLSNVWKYEIPLLQKTVHSKKKKVDVY